MIVCCGEALIDMLPRRSTQDEPAFAPYSGGALFNTAIALGRLGVPVEFFSGLSSDLFGDQLRATLAESKVGSRYAHTSARPTTPPSTSGRPTHCLPAERRPRKPRRCLRVSAQPSRRRPC